MGVSAPRVGWKGVLRKKDPPSPALVLFSHRQAWKQQHLRCGLQGFQRINLSQWRGKLRQGPGHGEDLSLHRGIPPPYRPLSPDPKVSAPQPLPTPPHPPPHPRPAAGWCLPGLGAGAGPGNPSSLFGEESSSVCRGAAAGGASQPPQRSGGPPSASGREDGGAAEKRGGRAGPIWRDPGTDTDPFARRAALHTPCRPLSIFGAGAPLSASPPSTLHMPLSRHQLVSLSHCLAGGLSQLPAPSTPKTAPFCSLEGPLSVCFLGPISSLFLFSLFSTDDLLSTGAEGSLSFPQDPIKEDGVG